MDGVAEIAVEGLHIAAIPRHFDGVADGALHPAGGGAVGLGNLRIEPLGHRVDVIRLVHGEQDGIPQELIALDVGGHTQLVEQLCDHQLVAVQTGLDNPLGGCIGRLEDAVCQNILVKRFDEVIRKALVQKFLHHFFALERPRHEEGRVLVAGFVVLLLDRHGIQTGHESVQQNHLRAYLQHPLQDLGTVFFFHGHADTLLFQCFPAGCRGLRTGIRH